MTLFDDKDKKEIMRIIFLGSSEFALPSLKALVGGDYDISLVVTQPDRKKGRGLALQATAVKEFAQERGLKLYQPSLINAPEAVEFLKNFNPDLFIVISYGQILSKEILKIPKIFAINAHASLLPKYRGAAPVNWAIIKGEATTGVTIMKIDEKMDTGQILLQKELTILPAENAVGLEKRLSVLASELLLDSLKSIENNVFVLKAQDDGLACLAAKLKKEDGVIDWGRSAGDICNLIRGCRDWPGAFSYYREKLVKIHKASIVVPGQTGQQPGKILSVSAEGIAVAAGKGNILITELQIEGKRKMTAREFISGHRISVGETFENKK